jgi:hypothetical protein
MQGQKHGNARWHRPLTLDGGGHAEMPCDSQRAAGWHHRNGRAAAGFGGWRAQRKAQVRTGAPTKSEKRRHKSSPQLHMTSTNSTPRSHAWRQRRIHQKQHVTHTLPAPLLVRGERSHNPTCTSHPRQHAATQVLLPLQPLPTEELGCLCISHDVLKQHVQPGSTPCLHTHICSVGARGDHRPGKLTAASCVTAAAALHAPPVSSPLPARRR